MELMWSVISLLYGYNPNLNETGKDNGGHHWSYEGDSGPDHWSDHFPQCGGQRQSPVDIRSGEVEYASWLTEFQFIGYDKQLDREKPCTIKNNGHTASMAITQGLTLRGAHLNGDYYMAEMHMHWGNNNSIGSEHAFDGKKRPAEIHFVHYAQRYGNLSEAMKLPDGLAVLGVFVDVTPHDNYAFEGLANGIDNILAYGSKANVSNIRISDFFPRHTDRYYHYRGSLTTPPCYESVMWFVMEEPIQMSERQLNRFRYLQEKIQKHVAATGNAQSVSSRVYKSDPVYIRDNYRPLQPLQGRKVYTNRMMIDRPQLREFDLPSIKVSRISKQSRAPVQPVYSTGNQARPYHGPISVNPNTDYIYRGLSPNTVKTGTAINGVISNGNTLMIGNIASNQLKGNIFQYLQPDSKYPRHQPPHNKINIGHIRGPTGSDNIHVFNGGDRASVMSHQLNSRKSAPLLDFIYTQMNGLTRTDSGQPRRYDVNDYPGITQPKDRIIPGLSDHMTRQSISSPSMDSAYYQTGYNAQNQNGQSSKGRFVSVNVNNQNNVRTNIQNSYRNSGYHGYHDGRSPSSQASNLNSRRYAPPTSYPRTGKRHRLLIS